MRSRLLLSAAALVLLTAPAFADDQGVEVLARGPVHEAYATTVEFPTPSPVVPKAPPTAIEELPPDQRPEGDNVQWLPGYWHWDEERNDFIWISGFWRVPPPGRVWVAGSWREARGGWQWVQGFWQDAGPVNATLAAAPQAELEYLPPPPQPLEVAPSVPSPSATSLYVPGNWVWRGRYVWRPGCWIDYRAGWVWIPAHYRWTHCGYVYVEGYWDHPLETRGVLFAPVAFAPTVIVRPSYVYTPTYVVSHQCMVGALFVRRGYGCYYFGDYFEPRYASVGFSSWCGSARGTSFAISVGFGRGAYYDPMWSYYQVHHRHNPVWANQVGDLYAGRYRGDVARPPRTLVQQTTVVNNITNVTNVTNINNKTVVNNVSNVTMVAPLNQVARTNSNVTLKAIERADRVKEQQHARDLQQVGIQRQKAESSLAQRNLTPMQPTDKPQQVKLQMPQQVSARAQAPTAPAKAPPPPATVRSAEPKPKVQTPISPMGEPKVGGKPVGQSPMGVNPLPLPPAPKPPTPAQPALPKPQIKPPTSVAPKPMAPTPPAGKTDLPPRPAAPPPALPKVDSKPMAPTLPAPKVNQPPRQDPKPVTLPPSLPKQDMKPALPPAPRPTIPATPALPKQDPKPVLPRPAPVPPMGKPEVKGPAVPSPKPPSTPPTGKSKDEKKKDK